MKHNSLLWLCPPNLRELFRKDRCSFTKYATKVMKKYVQLRARSEDLCISHLDAILTKGFKLDVEEQDKSMESKNKTKKVSKEGNKKKQTSNIKKSKENVQNQPKATSQTSYAQVVTSSLRGIQTKK